MHTHVTLEPQASKLERRRKKKTRTETTKTILIRNESRLCDLLDKAPSLFSQERISVVGKDLRTLGSLPSAYRGVRVMYLSRNRLHSLDEIAQFQQLETLSVSDNFLSDYDSIAELRTLRRLRNLNLEGNPITRRPHYRNHIIHLVPQIRSLDKRQVMKSERECSAAIVKREESKLLECFRRDCEIVKLKLCEKLLHVHGELRELAYGRPGVMSRHTVPPEPIFRLDTFMKFWRYDENCSRREIRRVRDVIVQNVTRIWSSLQLERIRHNKYGEDDSWNEAYATMSSIQNDTYVSAHASVETLALRLERRHLRLVSLHKRRIVKKRKESKRSWSGVSGAVAAKSVVRKHESRDSVRVDVDVRTMRTRKNKSIRHQRKVLSSLNNRRREERQKIRQEKETINLEQSLELAQQVLRVRLEVERKLKDANLALRSRIETMTQEFETKLAERDLEMEELKKEYEMRDANRQKRIHELEVLAQNWKAEVSSSESIAREKMKDFEMKIRVETDMRVREMQERMSTQTKRMASKLIDRFSRKSVLKNVFSRLREYTRKSRQSRLDRMRKVRNVLWSYMCKSEFQIKRRAVAIWRHNTVLNRETLERVSRRLYSIWKRRNLRDALSRMTAFPNKFDKISSTKSEIKVRLMNHWERHREKHFLRRILVSWRSVAARSSLARRHRQIQLDKYESEERLRARVEAERQQMLDEMSSSIHDITFVANRSVLYEEREAAAKIALRNAREEYASLKSEMIRKDETHREQSLELNNRIESLSQMLLTQESRMKHIEGALQATKEGSSAKYYNNNSNNNNNNNNESTMMMSFGVEESRFEEDQHEESISNIAEMARATASQLAHAMEHWSEEVEHKNEDRIHDDGISAVSPTKKYKTIVDEISTLEKNLLSRLSR